MDPFLPDSPSGTNGLSRAVRFYYRLKRFIPKRFRMALRKAHVSRVLASCQDYWPINESAGAKPDGWPGWPKDRLFAFVLTHDVEGVLGVQRTQKLAELEMEFGFRSSFNFVPEGEYRVPSELRGWLTDRGFEVGVHDLHHDGTLYGSKSSFQQSARTINQYIREWGAAGFRSGFMLHNLEWAHDLDVLYEASTFDTDPFEPQPDGAHTIFPFWVAAPGNGNQSDPYGSRREGYVELPYTLPQDSTVFIHLGHRSIDLWKRKLEWIASKGGMALVIVHPDYTSFDNHTVDKGEFPVALYREFLSFVKEEYASQYWHALPRDVASYCSQFKPMRSGDQSKVAGAAV